MEWSTREQLEAWWTPAKKAARSREDRILSEKYPGQYIAYTDDWTGDELTRTVRVASADMAEFHRRVAALESEIRRRLRLTDTLPVESLTIGSAFLE